MKKALALILALIMLCSSATLITFAADEATTINIEEMPGYEKAYVGAPIETAPVQDGTINDGEYTLVRKVKHMPSNKYKMDPSTVEFTECFAYDSEFIYYAVSHPGVYYTTKQFFFVRLTQDYIINQTPEGHTHKWMVDSQYGLRLVTSSDSSYSQSIPSGKSYPTSDEYVCVRGRSEASGKYAPITYELKISRSYLATQMGLGDASDVTKLIYSFYMDDCAFDLPQSGSRWGYTSCDHMLTDEQDEWLKSKGVTTSLDNSDVSGASLSRLCNMVVLDEDPSLINIEKMPGYEKTYIGKAIETAPVQDGTIGDDEYTLVRNVKYMPSDKYKMDPATALFTECFAYDEEFIYYAVSYPGAYWSTKQFFFVRLTQDYIINQTPEGHTNQYMSDSQYGLRLVTHPNSAYSNARPSGKDYPTSTEYVYAVNRTVKEGAYGPVAFELKISRSYLSKQMGLGGDASKVTKLFYSTYMNDCAFDDPYQGAPRWGYISCDHMLTDEQDEWLKSKGVTTSLDNTVTNGTALNRLYNMVVLGEEPAPSVNVSTQDAASARVSATNPGLRFKTSVDKAELDKLIAKYGEGNVRVGTLITLEERLGTNALTHAFGTLGTDYIDVYAKDDKDNAIIAPFETNGNTYVFAGSITNIRPNNLTKNFVGVGYVAYRADADSEWVYIYSETSCTRNVVQIAQAAVDAGEFEGDTAALEILKQLGAVVA